MRMAREQGVLEAALSRAGQAIAKHFLEARVAKPHLRLFVRFDVAWVASGLLHPSTVIDDLVGAGIAPESLVIHLGVAAEAYGIQALLEQSAGDFRRLGGGVALAMDELGMTYDEALAAWQRQHPEFIVLSTFTTQHLAGEGEDQQTASAFVRRACGLARHSSSLVLAEGVDNARLFTALVDLDVTLFQGAEVGVASSRPLRTIALTSLRPPGEAANDAIACIQDTIASILEEVPCITPSTRMSEAGDIFHREPGLRSLPVVDPETHRPVGIIRRNQFLEIMGTHYGRDLYGRKKVSHFLDPHPNIFELNATLEEVGQVLIASQELEADFIMTDQGRYAGIGRANGLLEKIINLRVNKVRYMNPLTGLPGNVPIQETLRKLLEAKRPFAVCYFDLDNFKAFNDVYGYTSGDRAILLLARLLRTHADPRTDFIGHIGGDDFIAFYCQDDWERRVRLTMDQFVAEARELYSEQDRQRGYIEATDRQGNPATFALLSVSVAAVLPDPRASWTTDDVARLAAEAKHDAKKIPGASLVIHERTTPHPERRQDRITASPGSQIATASHPAGASSADEGASSPVETSSA
jgi:diguanylate cyclase (GGDEF)-like protein